MKCWTIEQLNIIHDQPFMTLLSQAHAIHCKHHDPTEMQVCTLVSVKTGGCPEDCKYCPQSSRYNTYVSTQPLMKYEEVMRIAEDAKQRGVTRICLGAAWREVRDNVLFDQILEMVRGITAIGLEVCCTLGLLVESQAKKLKDAGLYSYNHNLDTSENYYKTIITTRTYQDRLDTLDVVEKTGIGVCCGGILGMGESIQDRLEMLLTLSKRNPPPDSIPINRLVAIPGTPLENQPPITIWELARIVATTRIVFPFAMIRLSAGRLQLSFEQQALCFFAGANSIHSGERLLTLPNTGYDRDDEMFELLGLKKRMPFAKAI